MIHVSKVVYLIHSLNNIIIFLFSNNMYFFQQLKIQREFTITIKLSFRRILVKMLNY